MTELHRKNQNDWTDDEWKQIFESRQPAYIFIANDGGAEGYNYIQCRYCGAMFRRTAQNMRPSRVRILTCKNCEGIVREHKERIRKEATKIYFTHSHNRGKQLRMIQCERCGQLFVQHNSRARFCSTACQESKRWHKREEYRYTIDLKVLYARDKGICHLCGRPCDWNDFTILGDGSFKVGDNYPTRDHLIPKSKGGEHSYQNIALAHHRCNSLRRDRELIPPSQKK